VETPAEETEVAQTPAAVVADETPGATTSIEEPEQPDSGEKV